MTFKLSTYTLDTFHQNTLTHSPIVIVDFGAQYAHLITNRIRRLHAYSEIVPHDISADELRQKNIAGIILSGGPKSVYGDDGLHIDPKILELGVPVLGICYGHQLLVHTLKGEVEFGTVHEFGKSAFHPLEKKGVLENFPDESIAWMSHVDKVISLPKGFETIGETGDCEAAAIMDAERNFYGVQFHPEVTHTERGMLLLENFVHICGVTESWEMSDFVETEIQNIQKQAAGKNVFLLCSGGVDSSVTFALLEKALGKDRVYGLFIDHGLLRKNEAVEVKVMLEAAGFQNLHVVNASEQFLGNLKGAVDPEKKREIIGNTFLQIQEQVTEELGLNPDEWLLGQGTIYPDTIESGGTKHAAKIKTHHNRVEKIEKLIAEGKIIEPVKDLYKDEVREVGRKLGLPEKMVARHPFPGPGLGVRILCANGASEVENVAEIERGIEEKFADVAAQVLPIKSVGVQGDFRSYRHPVVLYGVGNKLHVVPKFWDHIEEMAAAIPNTFSKLNRVVLCISSAEKLAEPTVIKSDLSRDRIALLQEADAVVRDILENEEFEGKEDIWQFPVVLCPVDFGGGETIILRPVASQEAMTASFSRIPWRIVQMMSDRIMTALEGKVSAVFYDVTNKPPGTIEWE